MDLTIEIYLGLLCIATLAGFIDAIAGGGGLLTIPALLAAGLPPAMALGTNKLQSCGGACSASLYFISHKMVNPLAILPWIILTFLGATMGTILIQQLDVESLRKIIPLIIFIIGGYFLFSPNLGESDRKARLGKGVFACCIAFPIGFYDGMFGPATGSFYTLAFALLLGFNLPKAVAHAKVLNFTSNIAALIFFALGGAIVWKIGLIMMIGQIIGGNLGARLVITKGKTLIKPMIVLISFIMVIKMLWDQGMLSIIMTTIF